MTWRDRLARLRDEAYALAVAARDPRTPWYARVVALLTVGLAASPIDPVPDFVPVLGYLDDLVFVPAGVALFRRLTPEDVLDDARDGSDAEVDPRTKWLVAGLVVAGWLAVAGLVGWFLV